MEKQQLVKDPYPGYLRTYNRMGNWRESLRMGKFMGIRVQRGGIQPLMPMENLVGTTTTQATIATSAKELAFMGVDNLCIRV